MFNEALSPLLVWQPKPSFQIPILAHTGNEREGEGARGRERESVKRSQTDTVNNVT